MRFTRVLVTIALMIPALYAQAPMPGTPGSIEGIVCEADHCKPIDGARVNLMVFGPQRMSRVTVSDAAGRFRFLQLPPAKYQLGIDADDSRLAGILPVITLTDGQNIQGVKIEMRALGTISGHAFDENGEPLVAVRVEAMTQDTRYAMTGPRWIAPVAASETDDRGEFRIAALEPGDYNLRVVPVTTRPTDKIFPATYYPNTTDPAAAAKISVSSGFEVSNIDLKLPIPGVNVRGRFLHSINDSLPTLLSLIPRHAVVQVPPVIVRNVADAATDEFEIRGVAPGSYYLYVGTEISPQRSPQFLRVPIEVGEHDVEGVTVAILPNGTIKGRITLAADVPEPDAFDPSGVTIAAEPNELTPLIGAKFSAKVSKTGQFEFGRLPEMNLVLRSLFLPDGWFVAGIRMDGEDVMASGFTSTPGKDSILDVVLSNVAGAFTGVIKDRQDKPLPAGRLLLLPEPSLRSNPLLVRTTVAVERGEFSIETIPPGEYTAIAFPDEDQFTPAFLRDLGDQYDRFGQHIHIGPRQTTRADLTVAPVESN